LHYSRRKPAAGASDHLLTRTVSGVSANDGKRCLPQYCQSRVAKGWMITHDPYELRVGGVEMYVDLGAEQLIAAERDQIKIAIEVKSFIGASAISEFHNAHGQFLDYRFALEEEEPDRKLYLAVPVKTYCTFFSLRFIQTSRCERRQNLGSI